MNDSKAKQNPSANRTDVELGGVEEDIDMNAKRLLCVFGLLIVVLGQPAQAYYNATTGRWLSRDPIQEMDGPVAYTCVANDLIASCDPFGLWKWKGGKRQRLPRAFMIAEPGDTTESAAKFARMSPADSDKWLQDSKGNSVRPGDKINECEEYTVPNTVYVQDLTAIPWWNSWQSAEQRVLARQGFFVVEVNNPISDVAYSHFSKPDVFGIVVVGHGDPRNHGDYLCQDTYRVSPSSALGHLHHQLGGLKLVICWGKAKEKEWKKLISPTGYLWSSDKKLMIWNSWPGFVPHGFSFDKGNE